MLWLKLKLLTVFSWTVTLRNSHSYWIRITSRDHSVNFEALRMAANLISSSKVENESETVRFPNFSKSSNGMCWYFAQVTRCQSEQKTFYMDVQKGLNRPIYRLTRVYCRLEREVAALDVKGEFVNLHPAGADQHQVVPQFDETMICNCEIRTRRGFVLLCPVVERKQTLIMEKALCSILPRYLHSHTKCALVLHTVACKFKLTSLQ